MQCCFIVVENYFKLLVSPSH